MKLTGTQFQQLTQSLLDAFPSHFKLTQMIRFKLEKNLSAIALGDDLQEIVFKLISSAEAEGWTAQLVVAARESNPGNALLFAFAQQFELAPGTPSRPELERIIRASSKFLDVNTWRMRLGEIETQVCRIEIKTNQGMLTGTGFLLGPSVLITNYHVMEHVILCEEGLPTPDGIQARREDVIIRFDYKVLAGGGHVNPGTEYRLAAQGWLLDKSVYAPLGQDPKPDELDYVLLKLDGEPGNSSLGMKAVPDAPRRGWMSPLVAPYAFSADTPIFIVQHPRGRPVQLALDTQAIISVNAGGTEVRYNTNTEPGSSGSPCFNADWELVALHHSGDPAWKPKYNAGTPFAAILTRLAQKKLSYLLGDQCP